VIGADSREYGFQKSALHSFSGKLYCRRWLDAAVALATGAAGWLAEGHLILGRWGHGRWGGGRCRGLNRQIYSLSGLILGDQRSQA
jgi:hypothetical protein